MNEKKFQKVFCSQCGGVFGPRNSGYSHCIDHRREVLEGTNFRIRGHAEDKALLDEYKREKESEATHG